MLTNLASLWLPILVSSVIVFLASSIIHMATPWHKGDYPRLPDEDKILDALRPFAIPPGDYFAPRASSMKDMRDPAFIEKINRGPVMVLTVIKNGPPNMNKSLILWFIYSIVIGLFAAYVAGAALRPGEHYLKVFQVTGAASFVAYSLGLWQMTIWYSRSASATFRSTVDGLIYALLTAGTFGWLWPR